MRHGRRRSRRRRSREVFGLSLFLLAHSLAQTLVQVPVGALAIFRAVPLGLCVFVFVYTFCVIAAYFASMLV